jgi:hypothetical protein
LAVLAGLATVLVQSRLVVDLDKQAGNMGDEAESLYSLLCVSRGDPLYRDFRESPHVLTPYMPLFYLIPGTVARWIGASEPTTVWLGRLYVYLCWVGVGCLLYVVAWRFGLGKLGALLAGLLWLAGSLSVRNAHAYRPDACLVFFSMAALWCYQRGGWAGLILAATVSAIGVFHKQSAGVLWVSLVGIELWRRQWSHALVLVGVFAAWVGVGWLVATQVWVDTFRLNVIGGLDRLAGWQQMEVVVLRVLQDGGVLLVGGMMAAILQIGGRPVAVARVYLAGAMCFAVATSCVFGSGQNYYLEPFAIGCLLVGGWTGSDESPARWVNWGRNVFALALVIVLAPTIVRNVSQLPTLWWSLAEHRAMRQSEQVSWQAVLQAIGTGGGPVLVEDPDLALRQAPAHPVILNVSLFMALKAAGRFDDSGIRAKIAAQAYRAIVTTAPLEYQDGPRHFPADWRLRMAGRYHLTGSHEVTVLGRTFYIYCPNHGQ